MERQFWDQNYLMRFSVHEQELRNLFLSLYHGDIYAWNAFSEMLYRCWQQRPAQKYRKSIKRYHLASRRMRKRSVLVLTKQRGYLEHSPGLDSCSPDKLATVIRDCLEDGCRPHPDVFAWLGSDFGL